MAPAKDALAGFATARGASADAAVFDPWRIVEAVLTREGWGRCIGERLSRRLTAGIRHRRLDHGRWS
jgi:hypothetical protein